MTPEERTLIDGLFERMRGVGNQPRDAEAEALIARRLAEMPYAPYALTQTVLVQEHALQQAYARVEELEAEFARREEEASRPAAGGFLGGLFGGGSRGSVPSAGTRVGAQASDRAPMGVPPGYAQQGYPPQQGGYGGQPYPQQGAQMGAGQQPGPWGRQAAPGGGGGGFLQGALATAAGVAGGALLFEGIKNMMGSGGGAVAQQAAAELGKPAGDAAGSLGSDAQAALGGAPQSEQEPANFWNADQQQDHQEASYDDGGSWGDDDSWA